MSTSVVMPPTVQDQNNRHKLLALQIDKQSIILNRIALEQQICLF